MRIVTYSRVSTSHHDQKPEVQVHELRRYCQSREWIITQEIVDHGYSGSTDNRPGLKQLMSMVRSKEVDVVIVLKLDRLFRSLRNLVVTLDEFESLGIKFIAVKDAIDYTVPTGRLFAQILGSLSEFEKSLLIERTMLGLAHAKSVGKILGRPKENDYEAIKLLRAKGMTYRQIQTRLGVSKSIIHRALVPKTPEKELVDQSF